VSVQTVMGAKAGLGDAGSSPLLTVPPIPRLRQFFQILKSTIPMLTFLFVYGINKVVHIQPVLDDLGCVNVHTLNNIEEFFLGFHPHKMVSSHHSPVLDLLSCIPYLIHYSIPVVVPLYLLLANRIEDISKFYWLIGWVMWVIYFVWLVFPHAPPWVIDHLDHTGNGTDFHKAMLHREGCAFSRIDAKYGTPFFYNMFSGNPIPFGSFPSGHVAWPYTFYLIGAPGNNWFLLYVAWMAWATLYSCHHYALDAVGAVVTVLLTRKLVQFMNDKGICNTESRCRPTSVAATCPFNV